MFGGQNQQQQQARNSNSFNTTIENALGNISGIMSSYNQHGSSSIPRRQKARSRNRSSPYTQVRPCKRKVVQLLCKKRGSSSREIPEPWPYKNFEEIWEGNIEYTDQTSEGDILTYICTAFNSQPQANKANISELKPGKLRFVHRKNGKVTTRSSATYDGAGIQCNYRQGIVYMLVQDDLHSTATVLSSGLETIPYVRYFWR